MTQKMVNCFFGKSRGGIEVVLKDYAESLRDLGYDSQIITLKERNYTDYIKQIGLPTKYMTTRGLNPLAYFQFIHNLYQIKPDVVFLHGTRAIELGTNKLVRFLFPKIKFVGISHGVASAKYKNLKYVMAITESLRQQLADLGIKHTYTCLNTTPECQLVPLKAPSDPLVIGSSGRKSPVKGFDILIKAIAICKEKGYKFRCQIAGCTLDDYKDEIKHAGVADCMEMLGWIEDKDTFYNGLDFYCSAATMEPFGLTLIEAMMHGRPVVATACQGAKEIMEPTFGIMVPIKDENALATAFMKMADDKNNLPLLGQQARQSAMNRFSRRHLPGRLDKILQDILKS